MDIIDGFSSQISTDLPTLIVELPSSTKFLSSNMYAPYLELYDSFMCFNDVYVKLQQFYPGTKWFLCGGDVGLVNT